MSDTPDMAQKIKELRLAHNLTLEQVANAVGVGKSTVRKWETGMIANMRRDKIASLAKALHTTPAYLMGWTDEITGTKEAPSFTLPKQIAREYGEDAAAALSLYVQLDGTDRLRINERMQTLLEDEKYTSQKAKRGQSPA